VQEDLREQRQEDGLAHCHGADFRGGGVTTTTSPTGRGMLEGSWTRRRIVAAGPAPGASERRPFYEHVERSDMMGRFALSLAALLWLAGCAGVDVQRAEGPAAPAPAYQVGDRWVYQVRDGFRAAASWEETHEIRAVSAAGISVRVTRKGPNIDTVRDETWDAPGVVRVGAAMDNESRTFAQPLRRLAFPLAPGASWRQAVSNTNQSASRNGTIVSYVRVGGWKQITTPAGTFDAVQVRTIMQVDDEEFWKLATECNYLAWYAPAVRGVVLEQKEATYFERSGGVGPFPITAQNARVELVSFTPGKG
jgi:hypothetical protein